MSAESIQWPTWQDVESGLPIAGANVVKWEADPRKHEHRNVPRRLVRVEVLPQTKSVCGQLCHRGINFLLVYEDEIEKIRSKMPSEELKQRLAQTVKDFDYAMEMEVSARIRTAKTQAEQDRIRAEVRATSTRSPWNMLSQSINQNTDDKTSCQRYAGYPPVVSLDIHPEPVPPPLTPTSYAEQQADKLAAAMGRALAQHLPNATKASAKTGAAGDGR